MPPLCHQAAHRRANAADKDQYGPYPAVARLFRRRQIVPFARGILRKHFCDKEHFIAFGQRWLRRQTVPMPSNRTSPQCQSGSRPNPTRAVRLQALPRAPMGRLPFSTSPSRTTALPHRNGNRTALDFKFRHANLSFQKNSTITFQMALKILFRLMCRCTKRLRPPKAIVYGVCSIP